MGKARNVIEVQGCSRVVGGARHRQRGAEQGRRDQAYRPGHRRADSGRGHQRGVRRGGTAPPDPLPVAPPQPAATASRAGPRPPAPAPVDEVERKDLQPLCARLVLARAERAHLAERLLADTITKQDVARHQLTVHADRGSSMASKPVAFLLADLGVTKSHSRPHVSNDNPFSESQFKTLKYRPEFPDRFGSFEDAHQFCTWFFAWYNDEHRHSGIAFHTPADVHYRRAAALQARAPACSTLPTPHTPNGSCASHPAASLLRVQGRVVESVDRAAEFPALMIFASSQVSRSTLL